MWLGRWPLLPLGTRCNSPAAGLKCSSIISRSRLHYPRHQFWSRQYRHPGVPGSVRGPIAPVREQVVERAPNSWPNSFCISTGLLRRNFSLSSQHIHNWSLQSFSQDYWPCFILICSRIEKRRESTM